MILADKCLELGLPNPHQCEEQLAFVKRIILEGDSLNTRVRRYIGIHNLHSIVPKLFKLGIAFEWVNIPVYCLLLKLTPPEPVIVIYMTMEQQKEYWKAKRKPIKEAAQ